jgi:hypothetical protein
MAITENKVITTYVANVEQEKRALDDLIRKIDQLKGKEAQAADTREQHFDQLVLDLTRANNGVEESVVHWGELNEKTFSFAGSMQKVAKTLAPWNQAVELGGKLIRGLSDGMDAYAATSVTAAKEVAKLKKEFEGYRDAVMQNVGALAVELLKPAYAYEEQTKALLKLGNAPAFKILYGDKGVLRGGLAGLKKEDFTAEQIELAKRYGVTFNEAKDPIEGVAKAFAGVKAAIRENVDYWNNDGQAFIDDFTSGMRKAGKAAKEAQTVRQLVKMGGTDYDFDVSGSDVLGSAAFQNYRGFAIDEQKLLEQVTAGHMADYESLRTAGSRYDKFNAGQSQSKLEEMFGPVDEFNVYAEAFNMLGGAVTSAMDAWIDGSMSAGEAVKKFIGQALKGLASQMAIESLKHGAYAIGSLAFGDVRGAGQHAAAAAAFGAGAAAAAVAARSLGGGGGSGSDQRGAGAGGRGGRGDGGSVNTNGGRDHRGDGGSESTRPIVMIVGSSFDDLTPRQRRQKAEETFERARRERDE